MCEWYWKWVATGHVLNTWDSLVETNLIAVWTYILSAYENSVRAIILSYNENFSCVILWHHNNNNDVWKYFLGNLTEERGGVSNFFGLLVKPVYSVEILGINKEMKDGNSCGCCHLILLGQFFDV